MSDDTLTSLVTHAIADHLAPLVKWLYATFAAVIVGTAFVVGMVYDVKAGIEEAKREARSAGEGVKELRAAVISHDRDLAVLKSHSK